VEVAVLERIQQVRLVVLGAAALVETLVLLALLVLPIWAAVAVVVEISQHKMVAQAALAL
jgi:hypothetical protein